MTTYADDIHLNACCRSVAQLDRALHYFGLVLDALTRHDMVINTTKSAIRRVVVQDPRALFRLRLGNIPSA